jgi:hypothetical protein
MYADNDAVGREMLYLKKGETIGARGRFGIDSFVRNGVSENWLICRAGAIRRAREVAHT